MKRGSIWPILIIVTLFLIIPLGYWYLRYQDSMRNVKGAKTSEIANGLYVIVNSNSGTWDLNSYLCKTRSGCLESLTSGDKLETKSAGRAIGYEVDLVYQDAWKDNSFLKIFVKSGWGAQNKVFNVINPGVIPGTSIEKIDSSGISQEVILVPVSELNSGFYKGPEFSD